MIDEVIVDYTYTLLTIKWMDKSLNTFIYRVSKKKLRKVDQAGVERVY